MEKRISARGIIIDNDSVILMFRRKINEDGNVKEYYVLPGGGVEENETLDEAVMREMGEEFGVKVNIISFLGVDEKEFSIANFYHLSIKEGVPHLGGPELAKNCRENYYEIKYVKISELDSIDVMAKDMILKAYNNQ